jgi:hypothetical protein
MTTSGKIMTETINNDENIIMKRKQLKKAQPAIASQRYKSEDYPSREKH